MKNTEYIHSAIQLCLYTPRNTWRWSMDDYQLVFGANIKKLRKQRGFTQGQLAERSGLSERYVSEVERGVANPRLMSLKDLANGLDVSVPDLFIFENSPMTAGELKERLVEALQGAESAIEQAYNSLLFILNKASPKK